MAGEIRNKAISASNEVEVEVEAELGKSNTCPKGIMSGNKTNVKPPFFMWLRFCYHRLSVELMLGTILFKSSMVTGSPRHISHIGIEKKGCQDYTAF